ncbi:MAG: outer membrane lipoprotein carrier protein LolA [Desulfuromonadales bacterium]|nr:outer membrane lipoprotein carrier protein LolA [Desulfuromonadales bacterium]
MINRSAISALCLAIFLTFTSSPAWAMSLSDVIRTLESPFQTKTDKELRIYDYSADFFQESKIASLDRLQRANGRVEVAFDYRQEQSVPDVKFRWQYDQPTTQEIVSDGKTLWVYLPENNQVIQSDIEMVNQARQNDPMTFLTGLGNLSRDFQISWATPNMDIEGNYILELTPRRVSSLISRLIIIVDRSAVEAYQNRGQKERPEMPMPVPSPPQSGGGFAFPRHQGGANDIWFPIMSTAVYDPNGNSTIIEFSNLRVNLGIPNQNFNFIMPAGVQVVRPSGKGMGF